MNSNEGHKILIVDDQQKNIQVLGSLLRQEDYIIGVAMNGKQALERLIESNDYDLVLLDVNMPIMNGFEVCKAIREHESLKEIPVIFLTALVDTDSTIKGLEAGGQDYVTKPFNSKELLARVSTHLELKKSKDQLKQVNLLLEKKVAERTKALQVANDKLLQLDKAKTDFLNIISHEIRTPLSGIVGVLSILNDFTLPDELDELFEILQSSSDRLEKFSLKALDISLLNTKGKSALNLMLIDLSEIINYLKIQNKEKALKKNIDISYVNESDSTVTLIDQEFISKSFAYIIDNAIKFANKNSTIVITTATKQKFIVVTVQDEGTKFPEGCDITTIQPFNTEEHVNKNPALSLFLTKQIIDAHGGNIEITNTHNGVKVTVWIPIKES